MYANFLSSFIDPANSSLIIASAKLADVTDEREAIVYRVVALE